MTLSAPAPKPPRTTPMTTGTTRTSAVVAMLRWPRIGIIAIVRSAMLARAATAPITVRFIALPLSLTGLARGHDMHVDPGPGREPRDPPHDRAAADQLPPAAALAGADDELGDLLIFSVFHQSTDHVVAVEVVPCGAHVGHRVPERSETVADAAAAGGGVAAGEVDDIEVGFDPSRHPRRPAHHRVCARHGSDADEHSLGGVFPRPGLQAGQVPGELLRSVAEEPQGQLAELGQVVGAEEVGESLGNLSGRVDLALHQPMAQLAG